MQDAWRAYLSLAMGLTEAPRKRAQEAVRRLAGTGGATAAQLQALAEELVSTSAANREALTKLVRFEVDRALGAVGLATADEVVELTRRVHDLERQLRAAGASAAGAGGAEPAVPPFVAAPTTAVGAPTRDATATGEAAPAKKAVAKKAVAKEAVAKKAVASRPPAELAPTEAPSSPRPAKRALRKRQPGGAA
ncbi:hypothetical protein QTQ03_02930 [Micromonospora sp. WMMA1363]|uniref:hypothetical protein n=1 Tax=Micromonospora sp. WMMA1363 TaxID=3053985 RepID=UPI00259CA0D3|nr:hypothetical protein [Micromonospora sp. WMMA1363]MDM4718600.1 hypothetical protein [Micromonospora sp. WMMA1363]